MNEDDLERELRSQRGPREEGYTPATLTMTLEDGVPAGPRRLMLPRTALFAGAVIAGVLAVAVVTGVLSGPGTGVGSTNSSSPSPEATSSVPGDCGPADFTLSAEVWGGAAGSRGTVVTIALAAGGSACNLPKAAVAEIVDNNGNRLVTGKAPTAEGSVTLVPDVSFQVGIAWSNWCGSQPAAPMTLLFGFGDQVQFEVGNAGSIFESGVPPCNGDGASTLSLTDLQPQS